VAAVVAMGPMLWLGPSRGTDFGFHLISWIDARHGMSVGVLYPHWAYSRISERVNLDLFSIPAHMDGGSCFGNALAVECCSGCPLHSVACRNRFGRSGAGEGDPGRWTGNFGRVRRNLYRLRVSTFTSAVITQS